MSALHPQVFTIPAHRPFLPALAEGLLTRFYDRADPLAFARVTVYLPTRRATRALAEQLLAAAGRLGFGRALALPAIRPLGDGEDEAMFEEGEDALAIPSAFPAMRRRLLLMALVRAFHAAKDGQDGLSAAQGLKLAGALERFLDHAETQGISLAGLPDLVTGDLARHWQEVVAFLAIVTEHWPALQTREGAIGGAERRGLLMAALSARLERRPPADPVIAAGSTGTIPATAVLLRTISRLDGGAVILPGLDQALDSGAWDLLDVSHPQGAMKALLEMLGVTRDDVRPFTDESGPPPLRSRVLNEALRPWDATGVWHSDAAGLRPAFAGAGADGLGLSVIEAPHRAAEADMIALLMRETLERPGETAALITPDRTLARAVAASLMRWDIAVDDSAGEPLAQTPAAVFLRLIARAAAEGLAPAALLAMLKHPFVRLGLNGADLAAAVQHLERYCLRGPRPAPGVAGLAAARDAFAARTGDGDVLGRIDDLLARLERAFAPFATAMAARGFTRFSDLVKAHIEAGEALATNAAGEASYLWHGDAGEALGAMFEEMLAEGDHLPNRPPADYPAFLDAMLAGRVVRPRYGRHPRLFIWGPLEARLQACDVAILGGLNDGMWPAEVPGDPWLSRAMAVRLGLPLPEQRLGLAAHDFVQAACAAKRVYLTRAEKIDGAPTIASRWLMRLATILRGLGAEEMLRSEAPWRGYAEALDRPSLYQGPVDPPAPAPPVGARPRQLSVTRIATWLRDPYAIYAHYILGLKPLDPLDLDADARLRGIIVHEAIEAMARHGIDPASEDALSRFLALGDEIFARARLAPATFAFWRPRFVSSAGWLIARERGWREAGERTLASEVTGQLVIDAPFAPFTLTARADRIDRTGDGRLVIADFKTGQPPTPRQIEACIEPQLPLEAAIAIAGGFEGVAPASVAALRVVQLMARTQKEPGEVGGVDAIAAKACAYLRELVARYDAPHMAYRSRVMVERETFEGDFDHLARVREWSAGTAEGDE